MMWELSYWRAGAIALCAFSADAALAERLSADATEFPRETRSLVDATVALFETVEATEGAGSQTGTLRLQPVPAAASSNGTLGDLSPFSTENGAVRHLTGYRITWYPVETLFGAVDFMGTWADAKNLVCGYVTWDMSNPDAPEMTDLVVNYVDIDAISDTPPADREMVLLDANCAFGDIDSNYMAMD